MKPEYWEDAEALIEADERSGWWRKFMLFFGVALLVGSIGFFTWKNNNTNTISSVEKNPDFNHKTEALVKDKLNNNQKESDKELINKNSESKSSDIENGVSKSSIISNDFINKKETKIQATKNQKSIEPDNKNQKLNSTSKSSFAQTIPSSSLNPNPNQYKATRKSSTQKDVDDISISPNSDIINSNPVVVVDPVKNDKTEIAATNQEDKQASLQDDAQKINDNDTEKLENEEEKEKRLEAVTFISPLNVFLLSNKEKAFEFNPECFPYKTKVYRFGITGGAVGYPLIENSSETPFIGFKGGLFAEHNLKTNIFRNKWSIGTELLYHYRQGNFVAIKEEAVIQYSFGRTSTDAKLTPKNLHYLEMPIYLKYHLNKVSFEAGGLVSYLLGVRGEVNQNDVLEKGWVDELGFNKVHANAILGIQFSLKQRLKFGIRANYSLNSILDKNAILPNGDALRESGPLYLTFKFSQYLK